MIRDMISRQMFWDYKQSTERKTNYHYDLMGNSLMVKCRPLTPCECWFESNFPNFEVFLVINNWKQVYNQKASYYMYYTIYKITNLIDGKYYIGLIDGKVDYERRKFTEHPMFGATFTVLVREEGDAVWNRYPQVFSTNLNNLYKQLETMLNQQLKL